MSFLDFIAQDCCRIGWFYIVKKYNRKFINVNINNSSDKCSMYDVLIIVLRKSQFKSCFNDLSNRV